MLERSLAALRIEIATEQDNDEKSSLYNECGILFFEKKDWRKAISAFTKAILLSKEDHILYSNRSSAYIEECDWDNAIADLTIAIKLNDTNPMYYIIRGFAFRKIGESEKALDDYQTAITLDPKNPAPYNNIGYYYWLNGDNQKALAEYGKVLLLASPNNVEVLSKTLRIMLRIYREPLHLNGLQKLFETCNKIILANKDAEYYFIRAQIHEILKHHQEALNDALFGIQQKMEKRYASMWQHIEKKVVGVQLDNLAQPQQPSIKFKQD